MKHGSWQMPRWRYTATSDSRRGDVTIGVFPLNTLFSHDVLKPKFHYADFPVKSATSTRQTRDVLFSPNSITPTSPHIWYSCWRVQYRQCADWLYFVDWLTYTSSWCQFVCFENIHVNVFFANLLSITTVFDTFHVTVISMIFDCNFVFYQTVTTLLVILFLWSLHL